jgi:hypothetical protein
MKTLSKWTVIPALACLALASIRAMGVGAAAQAPNKSLPLTSTFQRSNVLSYQPGKRFLITMDLGSTVFNNATYTCALTYVGKDDGKTHTENWDFLSAHPHPAPDGNLVTLKFRAKRTHPVRTDHRFAGQGTGSIVVTTSPPCVPAGIPSDPMPVDDIGVDPCDDM